MRVPAPTIFAALLLLVAAGFAPRVASAQPAEVSRVLRTIDFEERRLGNAEDLPMHWRKVDGPGLMHYVNGRLATDAARGGMYSFKFELNGGGLIYRYDPKLIRVQPGAHYRVEAYARTTILPHARARLTAYLCDLDGRQIAASVRHSELYAAPGEDAPWKRLEVALSAPGPREGSRSGVEGSGNAARSEPASSLSSPEPRTLNPEPSPSPAYLVIELGLLQPVQYAPSALGQRTLFNQDIRGVAWFDDVTVSQVPRVTISTDRPGNVFARGEEPRLTVLVNDRSTDDLAARLVIRDATDRVVYQRSGALDMAAAETLGPGRKRMPLVLPDLPPGWYSAALVMTSRGQYVGEQTLDFVRLADDGPSTSGRGSDVRAIGAGPDSRFGVIATDLPIEGWDVLPDVLPFLAAGRVKLAVWSDEGDAQRVDAAAFDRLLERLGGLGITPTACLVGLPPDVAERVREATKDAAGLTAPDAEGPPRRVDFADLLKAKPADWQPQLAQLVARHASQLDRWQLGSDGTDAFVTRAEMRDVYARVYAQFAELVKEPDLAMPWPAWYELEGALPATVALSVPTWVLPEQIPLYLQDLSSRNGERRAGGGATNVSLSLRFLDAAEYGRDVQIRDLAQRMVYALAAGASRIDVPLPFTVRRDGDEVVKQPQELLLILRTLMTTLGGTTFKGKVPIADGVDAFLFDRGGEGILVLWTDGSAGEVKHLALSLGERPARVDLWGNVTPLISNARRDARSGVSGGAIPLELGPMPVLLVGVDAAAAQLRASVAMDRPLLESSFEAHARRIRFTNGYRQAVGGTLKLRAPAGWTISPPTFQFTLNPGETFDREVTIEFPYNSFAGAKQLTAEFLVQGERNTTFSVPITLHLGLTDVGLQTMALREGNDVIVQQMITNYSDRPIDYTAFAIYPGQARQERLVTNLGPGRTTIKRYRFANVEVTAEGKVRSGLKEMVGTRILNDEAAIQ
jgi:hypothetical protein